MKYKICFAHTSFNMDAFMEKEFGLAFESSPGPMSRKFLTLDEEQATIMKLKFPNTQLFPEDFEFEYEI